MGSTAHALLFVLRRFNAIGGFRSPLLLLVLVFREVLFQVVPSAVCCSTSLSLCFLIVGIHASGISIPLCLLMVSGLSLMWVASLTLRVYQCESRSLNFTPFHSERWPVLLACSETAEVWVRVKRISLSCSLFLVGSQVRRSGNNRRSFRWRCPGVLGKIRSNAQRVLNNTKDRRQRKLEILVCEKLVSVSLIKTT